MLFRGLAAILIAFGAASAAAQTTADSLASGARVRIRAPQSGIPWRSVGVLDSLHGDTAYVHGLSDPPPLRGARLAVPLHHVERLEVSGGRASRGDRARRGAWWGLGVYAVAAGAYLIHEKATCRGPDCFGEGFVLLGLVEGIPVAAGIGASVGFVLPVESWRAVRLPQR